jgi:type 1 glutamine amidotransferase
MTIQPALFLLTLALPHPSGPAIAGEPLNLLVFTRTEGFRHASIEDGVAMLEAIAAEEGATLVRTEETDLFTPASLASYDVVIWLSTSGDVLDPDEQTAFEGFIQAGGGWVGIHSAADTEYGWPWYGELLGNGAWFDSHPPIQVATLVLEDPSHPGAGLFGATTSFEDEWYNFQANPREDVHVIMTLDESSYDPGDGAMGDDHPAVWAQEYDGGRAFYTVLGHRSQTYSDPRFKEQIRRAVLWAAGVLLFADGFDSGDTTSWISSE